MIWSNFPFSFSCRIILQTNCCPIIVHTYQSQNLAFTFLNIQVRGLLTFWIEWDHCSCSVIKLIFKNTTCPKNCEHSVELNTGERRNIRREENNKWKEQETEMQNAYLNKIYKARKNLEIEVPSIKIEVGRKQAELLLQHLFNLWLFFSVHLWLCS